MTTEHSHTYFEIPGYGMFVTYMDNKDWAITSKTDWGDARIKEVVHVSHNLELFAIVEGQRVLIGRMKYSKPGEVKFGNTAVFFQDFHDKYKRFNDCWYDAEPFLIIEMVQRMDELPCKEILQKVFSPFAKAEL